MNIKEFSIITLTGTSAVGVGSKALAAVSLSLEPSTQTINVGASAAMDLVISGLADHASPSLGAFDLDLKYDPAILSAVSLTFGSYLDLGVLGSSRFSDLSTVGIIHVDEVSFEDSIALNDAQPSTFTLTTLNFTGFAPGTSAVDLSFASLSDELGQSLTDFSTMRGSILVSRVNGVPDASSSALLFLFGVIAICGLVSSTAKRRGRLVS
jgi:hypothetical protein